MLAVCGYIAMYGMYSHAMEALVVPRGVWFGAPSLGVPSSLEKLEKLLGHTLGGPRCHALLLEVHVVQLFRL